MSVTLLCTVRGCGAPLHREDRRMLCARGHSFDLARSGYCNLLQPQDRRSRNPGDSTMAVAARRRILERGLAAPFIEAIASILQAPRTLLDAGCGVGHHLDALQQRFLCEAHGTDISIPAIDLAARLHPRCTWVVANADRFLPYASGSFEAVMSITSRQNRDEFRRVLTDRGRLLVALPGPDDLIELRTAVLGEAKSIDRTDRTVATFARAFELERSLRVTTRATLDHEAIRDVLAASYRGARASQRERVSSIEKLDVTMSLDLLLFASKTEPE